VAKTISRQIEVAWLQVDDLRLAMQRSEVSLPLGNEKLYFFLQPDVWNLPAMVLRDGLIGVGEAMTPAIEVVTENHDDQFDPAVIEGDGILPSLFARPAILHRLATGRVRGVFLVESDQDELLHNMMTRGRGLDGRTEAELRREAEAKWLYGQWLVHEAKQYGIPVLQSRPWDSLVARILDAVS
jgi:2-phosphoglycerate kinase